MKFGLTAFAVITFSLVWLPDADAGRVERRYKGQVVILKKRPPFRFRSAGHFGSYLKRNRMKHIWPKEGKRKLAKTWKFEYMAFFKRPIKDFEVKLKFFDVTSRKKFVAGDSVYTTGKGQTVLSSNITLKRPRFENNKKYMMYITNSRNFVLAKAIFWLRGQGEVYSGRVTFSDDETKPGR